MRAALTVVAVLVSGLALAEAPTTSPRPAPRPIIVAPMPAEPLQIVRPMPRPAVLPTTAPAPQQTQLAASAGIVVPKPRPAGLVTTASAPAAPKAGKKGSKKGSVCGDYAIRGEALSAIPAKFKGCGLAEPVRVSMVSGVTLNPAATISCETADALKRWIETGMRPAFGNREVVGLTVAASYICRTRNNQRGAKISEHGRGKAIDIAGFVMSDGTSWTVANNYNSTIRKAQKAACGIFGTTLGPGSDGFHEDHLHFDIAHYNSGPYCR